MGTLFVSCLPKNARSAIGPIANTDTWPALAASPWAKRVSDSLPDCFARRLVESGTSCGNSSQIDREGISRNRISRSRRLNHLRMQMGPALDAAGTFTEIRSHGWRTVLPPVRLAADRITVADEDSRGAQQAHCADDGVRVDAGAGRAKGDVSMVWRVCLREHPSAGLVLAVIDRRRGRAGG
jgi:hypothetical protein